KSLEAVRRGINSVSPQRTPVSQHPPVMKVRAKESECAIPRQADNYCLLIENKSGLQQSRELRLARLCKDQHPFHAVNSLVQLKGRPCKLPPNLPAASIKILRTFWLHPLLSDPKTIRILSRFFDRPIEEVDDPTTR